MFTSLSPGRSGNVTSHALIPPQFPPWCNGRGMPVLGCQCDCVWNELQSRHGGRTCDPDLEAGRHRLLIWILRQDDASLIWPTPSAGSLFKGTGEGRLCSLPACPQLASASIPPLALQPTSLGSQHLQKTN